MTAFSNERPVPRFCPEPGLLAEYIDGVLEDGERHAVQAHLVSCAACREVVADTARMLAPDRVPRSRVRSATWIAGFAAAAAILFGIYVVERREFRTGPERPELATLVAAVAQAPTRPVEGLLTGGFAYAPPPQLVRGASSPATPPTVLLAAADVLTRTANDRRPDARAAAGIADLLIGKLDEAIDVLEAAAGARPEDANLHNDLSVAYLARARRLDRSDDWMHALAAADRAIAIAPRLPQALFNRALALDGLHRDTQAAEAWGHFRTAAGNSPAGAEAAAREQDARTRAR